MYAQTYPSPTRCVKADCFLALPPAWQDDVTSQITSILRSDSHNETSFNSTSGGTCLVVLDDDPTGTQTVHGIPVLAGWSVEVLSEALSTESAFFVLTNSRSLTSANAVALATQLGKNLSLASAQTGVAVRIASRSDSTLRGHYPAEVDALMAALMADSVTGTVSDMTKPVPHLIIPFFEEGGRFTINNVHYVQQGTELVPAAETEFAKDKVFGYASSDLRDWVAEKTSMPADQVGVISLEDLRIGGPTVVASKLQQFWETRKDRTRSTMIINSTIYRDQEVFVLGLLQAEAQGCRFVYRTSASFVRVRAGIAAKPLLTPQALSMPTNASKGGLVVVGSYVSRSSEQLKALLQLPGIVACEVQTEALQQEPQRRAHIEALGKTVQARLNEGRHVVIYTSRRLLTGTSDSDNLTIGNQVSSGLCQIVQCLSTSPRFFIAKGGITSSDLATIGLGVKRAMVLGQALPGVPVWALGAESRFPGLSYVVFPGNVGDEGALAALVQSLT